MVCTVSEWKNALCCAVRSPTRCRSSRLPISLLACITDTNAVSSVIIVGALLAAGLKGIGAAQIFGTIAVVLAAVNIFGGFIVTYRMLSMFKKKPQAAKK